MNRFMFLCYVREDEGPRTKTLARSLAARGMKVVYRSVAPWLPSEQPRGLLAEEIQTGLTECCYGTVLLSPSFLDRNWPASELREIVSRVVNHVERLIHVRVDVSTRDIAKWYPPLAPKSQISLTSDYEQAADMICSRLLEDGLPWSEAAWRTQLNLKSMRLFACRECGSQADMSLECVTAPPIGASGMLVCAACGRGYPIRNGIPQLLSEGAVHPDEPSPPNLQPLKDLDAMERITLL